MGVAQAAVLVPPVGPQVPSFVAPSRSIAACERRLRWLVWKNTDCAASVSKACPSINRLLAVLTWVRQTEPAWKV